MHLCMAKTPCFHFHLTAKSSYGRWLQILGTRGEFQFSNEPSIHVHQLMPSVMSSVMFVVSFDRTENRWETMIKSNHSKIRTSTVAPFTFLDRERHFDKFFTHLVS